MLLVAVDIGGTFTDLVAFDDETLRLYHAKRLTTLDNLVQGIMNCLLQSDLHPKAIGQLIHGSTIAINTLIERKGARTALLVTKGTRDVYAIGRGNRPDAYNLFFKRPKPLVPRHDIFEVDERIMAGGLVLRPLDPLEIRRLAEEIRRQGFESVGICFLHSYAAIEHERQAGEIVKAIAPKAYVSMSHEIMREYREYERMSTTAVNAYVGPKVADYVRSLDVALRDRGFPGELSIMQSNGGVMAPEVAVKRPVMMMESGPVGGIIACAEFADRLGYSNSISFDMGGTTAKASLIRNGSPTMASGYFVGGYQSGDPIMIPILDIVEVGAGGGSIARIDEVGALKVGPTSAGSDPGPVCYGLGGLAPTITDANLALNRIGAEDFLGGEMPLDRESAQKAIRDQIAEPLGLDIEDAARAIIDIAVAKMSLAVRQVSVEKGYDPRDFALVASGGAGPLHAVSIARDLRIPTVIIPWFPSHFSALGMLIADERHDAVRTFPAHLAKLDFVELEKAFDELEIELRKMTRGREPIVELALDLRYVGQEFSLSTPITRSQLAASDRGAIRAAFDAMHEQRYEHSAAAEPIEVINIRVMARIRRSKPAMPSPGEARTAKRKRRVFLSRGPAIECPVFDRDDLAPNTRIDGPALIQEYGSTTVLFPEDRCEVAQTGELVIEVSQ